MYFLGLAGNYDFSDTIRHVFSRGSKHDSEALRAYLAAHYGATKDHVALFHTGRSALTVAIRSIVRPGGKVVITSLTCKAVVQAVKAAGCEPLFADVDPKVLHFGAKELEHIVSQHQDIEAVIVQNNLGIPADIKGIEKIAKKHQISIIEDLAHCAGVRYADGREAGTLGRALILSFGKGKSIDTVSGGAVVLVNPLDPPIKQPTKLPKLSTRLRDRWYPALAGIIKAFYRVRGKHFNLGKILTGILIKLHFIERSADAKLDTNERLADWQAKLALRQLQSLPKRGRKPLRDFYLVSDREAVLEELEKAGFIFHDVWYDVPVSPIRYYHDSGFDEKACPIATKLAKEIINVPRYYMKSDLKPAISIIEKHQQAQAEKPEKTTDNPDEVVWRKVMKQYSEANFLQSPEWATVNKLAGHKVVHKIFTGKNHPKPALCSMIIKRAKRGRYLEIPGGPLMDWENQAAREEVFDAIKKIAKEQRCSFIRMRPQLLNTPENHKILKELGTILSPMHLHAEHTVILDLTKSEDQLLAEMRRQTRYEVRRADKKGLKVTTDNSIEAFEAFHQIQAKTAERQKFVPPSKTELLAERQAFGEHATLYASYSKEEKLVALGLILKSAEEADYFEAASTDLNRHLPGAYALQWQVIKDLKKEGYKRYNLWGIAPAGQPRHRYAKVTTFKTGFGGDIVNFLPAHDIVINPIKYLPVYIFEKIRKKHRHLT